MVTLTAKGGMYQRGAGAPVDLPKQLQDTSMKQFPRCISIAAIAVSFIPQVWAALYQWSIPQEPGRRAYLWIPEKSQRIRGLVVDMNNLTESAIIENSIVRKACAEERVGILWIAEGSWCDSPFGNVWGQVSSVVSKDQADAFGKLQAFVKSAGANPTPEQVKAKTILIAAQNELDRQAGEYLDNMLKGLADESGYPEVRYAPLLIIGHSMTGQIAWQMPYYIPDRMWGAIPIKTGVRGAPWNMPTATMADVPVMYINQIDPDGGKSSGTDGGVIWIRQDTSRLFCRAYDWGGTHFEMLDDIAGLVALFIRKAAQYRLCDEIPTSGYPKLKELKPESGWLATSLLEPQQFPMAPEPQYKGDKSKAFWFFDEEFAKAVVGFHIADRTKKKQYVTVVDNGTQLMPFTGAFDSVKIPFESGIGDGFTWKLTGALLDKTPTKNPADSVPCGHAASGTACVRIAGGGSLAMLGSDTFRFRPGNMGFNGKSLNCWLVATHPGDAEYARCNQYAWLWMPEKLDKGVPQTLTFGKPQNVVVGTKEITLNATASSGLPVEYYVVSGPAEVEGGTLRFTPIPPHAKLPVRVIVTAYQMGRTSAPLTQSAEPVEQTFLIVASDKELALQPSPLVFTPPSARMPVLAIPLISKPDAFYGTAEAKEIAENLLAYQLDNGSWPKNYDWQKKLSDADWQRLNAKKKRPEEGTFDNAATHSEIRFMDKMYQATRLSQYKEAALKGLYFMLSAQYPNGGFPQFPCRKTGYYIHVTYNDGAMIGVLEVLRQVAEGKLLAEMTDDGLREKCKMALSKGIDCILKSQILFEGKPALWCAQHDKDSLQPVKARSYELPSFSGSESVGIVRFLMSMDKPSKEITASIEGAVAFFERLKLKGIRVETKQLPDGTQDRVVVDDPTAKPMWARFYDLKTLKPIYCSRDGIPREKLSAISHERRNGYSWIGYYASTLLEKEYPAWKHRIVKR